MSAPIFGCFFVGNSYPITESVFVRNDPTHWVLDVLSTVGDYHQLKEVAFFLLAPNVLPPEAALGLYISVGGGDWLYRGFVSSHCPSAVMPLSWPEQSPVNQALLGPGAVQIGVSVESYEELRSKEGSRLAGRQEFVKRVATDLFRFMESFSVGKSADQIVVPANVMELWYNKIQHKLERDPELLLHGEKSS